MLLVDTTTLPHKVGETIERDTYIKYRESRPTPRRLLNAQSQAFYFESTQVLMSKYKNVSRFVIATHAEFAAGPVFVSQMTSVSTTTTPNDELLERLDSKKSLGAIFTRVSPTETSEVMGTFEAFTSFCNAYDLRVSNPSVLGGDDEDSATAIQLMATDSPLFYPLNSTNMKHLYGEEKAAAKHASYLFSECENVWAALNKAIDPVADDKAVGLNVGTAAGTELIPGTVLYRTIDALMRIEEQPLGTEFGESDFVSPQTESVTPLFIS